MKISNYLNYVHRNLGLREVLISPEILETMERSPLTLSESAEVPAESKEEGEPPILSVESTYSLERKYEAIFVRVSSGVTLLNEDLVALDLFQKLRKALHWEAEKAPWVEVSLADWMEVLPQLRSQAPKVLLMVDDQLKKGVGEPGEWMIPDPAVLAQQPDLKRPTWELLKEWRTNA